MNLLEELNQKAKNNLKEDKEKPLIKVEVTYLKENKKYKRTVMVESEEAVDALADDFRKRFKDLIEIRSNGALIRFAADGLPYIDWEDEELEPDKE